MSITKVISDNLRIWMKGSQNLNTIEKVSERSGVGFGTVRRMRNGDGNPTITNLVDVAKAFGRTIEDLLKPSDEYATSDRSTLLSTREPSPPHYGELIQDIIVLAEKMNERGQAQLAERAEMLAARFPASKGKRAA